MTIGFIGAGRIGIALAEKFVSAGYPVVLSNKRGVDSLKDIVFKLGNLATAGSVLDAAESDFVVVSVRWNNLSEALSVVPDWKGKIVIDTNNQILKDGSYEPLDGKTSSEIFASLVPGAKVIKAFNHLFHYWIKEPTNDGYTRRVVFVSGDDKIAKSKFKKLLLDVGYAPIDLGGLSEGGKMQQAGEPLATMNLFMKY